MLRITGTVITVRWNVVALSARFMRFRYLKRKGKERVQNADDGRGYFSDTAGGGGILGCTAQEDSGTLYGFMYDGSDFVSDDLV